MNPSTAKQKSANPQSTAVDYEPGVLREIFARVMAESEGLAHGGVEACGVLFGVHSRQKTSVLAMRSCSTCKRGVFVLDDMGSQEVERLLSLVHSDRQLAGLEPVGWYLSQGRASLDLRPSQRELLDRYFAHEWQIALLVRNGRNESLRAATLRMGEDAGRAVVVEEFVIRQAKPGQLGSTEFARDPKGGVIKTITLRGPEGPGPDATEPASKAELNQLVPAVSVSGPAPAVRAPLPSYLSGSAMGRWLVIMAVVSCLAIAGAGAAFYIRASSGNAMGLRALERDGILQIEWDTHSRAIRDARTAKLEIVDGDVTAAKDLTKSDLEHGLFATIRRQADVTARLRVFDASGKVKEEWTRYAGRPIAHEGSDPATLQLLRNENNSLRADLTVERRRASELKAEIRVLRRIVQSRRRR